MCFCEGVHVEGFDQHRSHMVSVCRGSPWHFSLLLSVLLLSQIDGTELSWAGDLRVTFTVSLCGPLASTFTHTHTQAGRFHLWCDTSLKLNLLSRDLLWSDETSCSFWEWAVNHYTGLDRHTLECVCMNNELLTLLHCIDIITCMKAFPMCVC